jgi:hypothetical protein
VRHRDGEHPAHPDRTLGGSRLLRGLMGESRA